MHVCTSLFQDSLKVAYASILSNAQDNKLEIFNQEDISLENFII